MLTLTPTSMRLMFWMKSRSAPEPLTVDSSTPMLSTIATSAGWLFCAPSDVSERILTLLLRRIMSRLKIAG